MTQTFRVGQKVRIHVNGDVSKVGVIHEVFAGEVRIFVKATNELICTPVHGLELVE